jgi:hypothetical protein
MSDRIQREPDYTPPTVKILWASAQDETISLEALGLMVYILSKPDDWICQLTDICKRTGIGMSKAKRVMKELIAAGYVKPKERYNDKKGHINFTPYIFHSNNTVWNTVHNKSPLVEKPLMVEPSVGKPSTVIEPHTVYRDNNSKKDIKEKINKKNAASAAISFSDSSLPTVEDEVVGFSPPTEIASSPTKKEKARETKAAQDAHTARQVNAAFSTPDAMRAAVGGIWGTLGVTGIANDKMAQLLQGKGKHKDADTRACLAYYKSEPVTPDELIAVFKAWTAKRKLHDLNTSADLHCKSPLMVQSEIASYRAAPKKAASTQAANLAPQLVIE